MKLTEQVERFAETARTFCAWATSGQSTESNAVVAAAQAVSNLLAAGFALGPEAGEPAKGEVAPEQLSRVAETAAALPFQYYSEVFNNLIVPLEEPVVGDIVDDSLDIYRDISIGLALFDQGKKIEAADHWRFWFLHHWGEHATSVIRALWSYVGEREGAPSSVRPRDA